MSPSDLVPAGSGLAISTVTLTPQLVGIAAASTSATAACPACGAASDRVHSRYVRTAADLPWQGRRVVLRVTARRFRCRTAGCPRRVFCERLPAVLAAHARATGRLTDAHRAVGFALGGEAGSRLCEQLAAPASPDTLLRRVKAAPAPTHPVPRVVGVDDFAFRKGHTYGTILVDLERRAVIDLLPDRTAETLAAWLRSHPGVAVVSRDRASAYAQAAAEAAPGAAQVADRFHLLVNVREAVEGVLARHPAAVRAALTPPEPAEPADQLPAAAAPAPPAAAPESTRQQRLREAAEGRRQRRRERYEEVGRLRAAGASIRAIAQALAMSPVSILRFLRVGHTPDGRATRTAPSQLDRFRDVIDERVAAGCRTARVLHRELRGRGYTGGYDQVRRALRRRTGVDGRLRLTGPAGPPAVSVPSARRLSFAVLRRPDRRSDEEQGHLERLRAADGAIGVAVGLGEQFAAAVRSRSVPGLEAWLAKAGAGGLPEFTGLARSLTQDGAAVRAGILGEWSNGQVEGAVNRLKAIKRQMFGRAGFALLKARVLGTG
jgi:transposase